ncbi:MAG TPA: DUF4124 domain-containing protein [Steroidobacter sp.]
MFRPVLLLTLAALAAGNAVADVYMYKDEKGNTQYTDKPPLLPAERLNVQSQRTDTVAAQERSQAVVQRTNPNAPAAGNSPADKRAATETTAKDKAERCIKARERYDKYMNSPRLFEEGKDGERRYLSAAELDAARAGAKASMDAMCQ